MAKKAEADKAAPAGAPAKPPAAAGEGAPAKSKEPKKPREPKTKTAPAPPAPQAGPAVAEAPAATKPETPAPTPAALAAAPAPGEPTKKKGKRPGVAPARGKKLRNLIRDQQQRIAKDGPAPVKKAVNVLKKMKRTKFDETVEVHMALGVDMTQSDQMVRGSVSLPHGIGKAVRLLVFCQGDNVAKAKEAGADYAGSDDLIKQIQSGWTDFDVALATQDMMGQVSRLGKILGPRGLMPTPKAGTVIPAGGDVSASVREFKAGKVEYRSDKGGNVHAGVGKMSFEDDKLADNINAFVEQIRAVKPAGVKGNYVKSITIAGTMTPGVAVAI